MDGYCDVPRLHHRAYACVTAREFLRDWLEPAKRRTDFSDGAHVTRRKGTRPHLRVHGGRHAHDFIAITHVPRSKETCQKVITRAVGEIEKV